VFFEANSGPNTLELSLCLSQVYLAGPSSYKLRSFVGSKVSFRLLCRGLACAISIELRELNGSFGVV